MTKEVFEENVAKASGLIRRQHGIARTKELTAEGISYKTLLRMVAQGQLVRAKSGYYTLPEKDFSEEELVCTLFGDGVLTMESALYFHGYIDTKPKVWQTAISKNTSKSRFKNPPIPTEPYYTEERVLPIGAAEEVLSEEKGLSMRVYGIDRLICDVLKYEEKMDRSDFRNAAFSYISDERKDVSR